MRGARAMVRDHRIECKPWPFQGVQALEDVEIWHGLRDGDVPVACAQHNAALVPKASLHVFEPCGHEVVVGLIANRLDAIAADSLYPPKLNLPTASMELPDMNRTVTNGVASAEQPAEDTPSTA